MSSWSVVIPSLVLLSSLAACDSARVVAASPNVRRDAAASDAATSDAAASDAAASDAVAQDSGPAADDATAPREDAEVVSPGLDASADAGVPSAPDAAVGPGFLRPAGTIALGFTADDSANRVYTAADGLAWKGSFRVDAQTRVLQRDPAWAGPFPLLFDDGAWTTGGHEPAGEVAGDHRWGVTVFVVPEAMATIDIEYGAIRGSVAGSDGVWIWEGFRNGFVTIPAAATADITVPGLTIRRFGTTDLRLTLDVSVLAPPFTAAPLTGDVRVKSIAWGWTEAVMSDDGTRGDMTAGDGRFTFVLSEMVGAGRPLGPLFGLLRSGDQALFVLVIGGVEYRVAGFPSSVGVSAELQVQGGVFVPVPVRSLPSGDRLTYVDVP